MLFYLLKYDYVLYVMNNEIFIYVFWGKYWIVFIYVVVDDKGVEVYCIDMFNDVWNLLKLDNFVF